MMGNPQIKDSVTLDMFPPAPNCRLIDFEKAVLISPTRNSAFLVVSGTKPFLNMVVTLNALAEPDLEMWDYWPYHVIGCVSGRIIAVDTPYVASVEISLRGLKGVQAWGSNKHQKIKMPPAVAGEEVVKP